MLILFILLRICIYLCITYKKTHTQKTQKTTTLQYYLHLLIGNDDYSDPDIPNIIVCMFPICIYPLNIPTTLFHASNTL